MVNEGNVLPLIAIVILSYLIGSIPTAYLIAKARNINIFEVGSGNMGGTNVARAMGGIHWGVLTIALDAFKAVVAVAISWGVILPSEKWAAFTISSIVVVVGHNWSLFATLINTATNKGKLTIRGGKGGATAFGTMLMVAPAQTIVGMLTVGILLAIRTRYASLGVLSAFAVALLWMLVLVAQSLLPREILPYLLLIALLIFWRFRENIQSLLAGTERRLGEKAQA